MFLVFIGQLAGERVVFFLSLLLLLEMLTDVSRQRREDGVDGVKSWSGDNAAGMRGWRPKLKS